MRRHLISDAHEWINEISTVPNYYPAKPQPRERAWDNQRGKKTPLKCHFLFFERVLKIFFNCLKVVESKFWQA